MAKDETSEGRRPGNGPPVPLDEFLVQSQKCLARSVQSAEEAAKAESSFSVGDRPMYVIEGLDFELNVGVRTSAAKSVELDFETNEKERSKVRFRIERKPIEVASGRQLVLSNLDPLGDNLPRLRLRINYMEATGGPVTSAPIALCMAESGDQEASNRFEFITDVMGRVELELNLATSEIQALGSEATQTLRLRFRGECFLWVEDAEPRRDEETAGDAAGHAPSQSDVMILPFENYQRKISPDTEVIAKTVAEASGRVEAEKKKRPARAKRKSRRKRS